VRRSGRPLRSRQLPEAKALVRRGADTTGELILSIGSGLLVADVGEIPTICRILTACERRDAFAKVDPVNLGCLAAKLGKRTSAPWFAAHAGLNSCRSLRQYRETTSDAPRSPPTWRAVLLPPLTVHSLLAEALAWPHPSASGGSDGK
jgi:hypothetical protein